jgi:hypothetical protein
MWADCPQYGLGETRLCNAHLIIVVRHAQDVSYDIARMVAALSSPWQRASEPNAAGPKDGTIYYLRSGGYVKIGWTSDLQKRMRAYPPDTVLLAVRPGTRADENATHKRFAHLVTHGREWFPLAPQISEHIDQVLAENGPPPTVEFAARKSAPATGQRQYIGGPNRGKLAARQVRG